MNMLTFFDSVCSSSYPDPGFWLDQIPNAPGGATEALPNPEIPSPNFLLNLFFQLAFLSCDQQRP